MYFWVDGKFLIPSLFFHLLLVGVLGFFLSMCAVFLYSCSEVHGAGMTEYKWCDHFGKISPSMILGVVYLSQKQPKNGTSKSSHNVLEHFVYL
jgi:hypothetical protein